MRKGIAALVLATVVAGAVAVKPGEAQAQTATPPSGAMTATPQGLIGTALLGAEAVIMIEGLAGVRNRWILIGTGAAGLVAGGVGGFFIDQALDGGTFGGPCSAGPMSNCGPSEISTALLVVGLGLIIPTAIVYANAMMYRPENDTRAQQDDNTVNNTPLEESTGPSTTGTGSSTGTGTSGSSTTGTGAGASGSTGTGASAPATTGGGGGGRRVRRRGVPEALLNFDPGRFHLGVPSILSSRVFTLDEMRQYGAPNITEFRVPILSAQF